MFTIPNQSSVPKAYPEFDDAGRMKPSPYDARVVDIKTELVKFTVQLRDRQESLRDRHSEREQNAEQLSARLNSDRPEATPECPLWVDSGLS
ncbi:arsenical resistance protein ArsH [Pseudomonas sp. S32]|nr:arsenical resistance protein ArsH [Pseudomonas sp. S32]